MRRADPDRLDRQRAPARGGDVAGDPLAPCPRRQRAALAGLADRNDEIDAAAAAAQSPALAAFIAECKRHGTAAEIIETAEKQGFDTGIRAVHPFDPNWTLPVYVANFILMDYGTGAIFGCPAHDQRDLDFVRKYDVDTRDKIMFWMGMVPL